MNVTVIDANDHHPVFVNSSYSGVVLEEATVGTTVLNVCKPYCLSYHIIIWLTILNHSVPDYTIICHTVLYYSILRHIVPYCALE